MLPALLVFLGGGAGAVARFGVGAAWLRLAGPSHPWGGTLLINTLGGLLMGALIAVLAGRAEGGERARLLLGIGALGGFTTFSTFSLEMSGMLLRRAYGLAAGYGLASALLSTGACFLALMVLRRPG